MLVLQCKTKAAWLNTVLSDFDHFLIDHAACERKASAMAMTFVAHYPDRARLVRAMLDLAIEELHHFRQVVHILEQRQLILSRDSKDAYVNELHRHIRRGSDHYFLDRLLLGSIIEARGHERFNLVANALEQGKLKDFYQSIAASEQRHHQLFLELAKDYFNLSVIEQRLQKLLTIEAQIIQQLPPRAALH